MHSFRETKEEPTAKKIVYVSFDFFNRIKNKEYQAQIKEYLALSVLDKIVLIESKIKKTYETIKAIHPDAHVIIVMRETAIGPGSCKTTKVADNILHVYKKNHVLTELAHLTEDRELTVFPGSLAYQVNDTVNNRAYVLHQGDIVYVQGKENFAPTDFPNELKGIKKSDDRANQILSLPIMPGKVLKVLISICLDFHAKPSTEEVDLHLIFANTVIMREDLLRGKLNIYCDANRPPFYKESDKQPKVDVYHVPLVGWNFELYLLTPEQVARNYRNSEEENYRSPEMCETPRVFDYTDIYPKSSYVSAKSQIMPASSYGVMRNLLPAPPSSAPTPSEPSPLLHLYQLFLLWCQLSGLQIQQPFSPVTPPFSTNNNPIQTNIPSEEGVKKRKFPS